MKNKWLFVSTGFAMFSMFFGSGNLVFPITVGQESEGYFLSAGLGIILTGVIIPFLGVIGMMLFNGNLQSFFSCLGKKGTFIFSLIALALMGPFGVLARCLTVAHGALLLLFPGFPLVLSSFVLSVIIYFLAGNRTQLMSTLGIILTPLLLLSITIIAIFGLKDGFSERSFVVTSGNFLDAFRNGFYQGYQTMDLLAAFFFSHFIIKYMREKFGAEDKGTTLIKSFCLSALIGAGLLSLVYFALVLLGWIYSPLLLDTPPQEMLGMIALKSLGPYATPFVCLAIFLACITTAVVLTSLFSDFLRNEVFQKKLDQSYTLLITLLISFCVSTFDFAGIAKFLGPILETIYPALIALTFINIARWMASKKEKFMEID